MTDQFCNLNHGEQVTIDPHSPKVQEALHQIGLKLMSVTEYTATLAVAFGVAHDRKLVAIIPCKRCMLDIALHCRDLG